MYVDGGLLERIPIDAARDLGADVVVAVDVTERGQKRAYPRNIVDTLRATVAISDWYISSRREHRAEMLVVPDVYEIDPLSARDAEVCVKRGREAALSRLDEIKELIEWEK